MNHALTTCISEIGFLQERIREKNARIAALEAALREITEGSFVTDTAYDAIRIARAALAPETEK